MIRTLRIILYSRISNPKPDTKFLNFHNSLPKDLSLTIYILWENESNSDSLQITLKSVENLHGAVLHKVIQFQIMCNWTAFKHVKAHVNTA